MQMLRRAAPYLAGILTGMVLSGLILILSSEPRGQPIRLLPPPTAGPIRIHVAGAVRTPGVYELPPDSIVSQAVDAAGGALDRRSLGYVNLAASLQDGARVYIPTLAELTQAPPDLGLEVDGSQDADRLDLNQAEEPQLERLPGIGPSLASSIVEYRRTHGEFASVQELLDVPGIGPAKLAAIEDLVAVR
jgi:competence protein ComEA